VTEAIRAFMVDDHELIRRALHDLLSAESDIDVVGEAGSVEEAAGAILERRPDVVVLDLRLPDGTGVELIERVRDRVPGTRWLVLTSFDDPGDVRATVEAGAAGYLLKDTASIDCVQAVRRVASGQRVLDPTVAQHLLDRSHHGPEADLAKLTPQEHRVASLLAEGLSNRQIGHRLGLAEKTVKNHVSAVLTKLGAANRTEAALRAARDLPQH
jgi:two-component system, NarL family, response regulator DevR